MNRYPDHETGGYFELDLPVHGEPFPSVYLPYQSGRAALRAFLEGVNISRIWLPSYICNAVIDAARDAAVECQFYSLDCDLYPNGLPNALAHDAAVLYVNYFGLCEHNLGRLLNAFPDGRVIIDNTQALFSSPRNAAAAIYSPRKFVGVPDGGYLVVYKAEIPTPLIQDTGSLQRMEYLLRRFAHGATNGYSHYVSASKTLENTQPLAMSQLTTKLLTTVDMTTVRARRRENFMALSARLDRYNRRRWVLDSNIVPLCYPLTLDVDVGGIRQRLAETGIYIPTYWTDAEARIDTSSVESMLVRQTLALPCDQRYSISRMNEVADAVVDAVSGKKSSH
jgi:hypothetical protein